MCSDLGTYPLSHSTQELGRQLRMLSSCRPCSESALPQMMFSEPSRLTTLSGTHADPTSPGPDTGLQCFSPAEIQKLDWTSVVWQRSLLRGAPTSTTTTSLPLSSRLLT
jgi:hypothetical protein